MTMIATTMESTHDPTAVAGYNVARLRADFPILNRTIHGKPLVYLDNAATTQKPLAVMEAMDRYYRHDNANIHRGVHELSVRATEAYEAARTRVQRFLGAARPEEIVFVRGATEGINLVAQSCGRPRLQPGDEVVITAMEHHSNIVPWQMVCQQTGARLRAASIRDNGEIDLDEYAALLGPRTRIVAVTHVSNALGTVNPVRTMIDLAHRQGAVVLVDGAQAVPHLSVDVSQLDCDFYVFSGHKIYGPTGVGVLYGRKELLDAMPPYQGGGDMIRSVTLEKTTYADVPYKFEAGTPNIAGGIGLAAALEYVQRIGLDAIGAWEHDLLARATAALSSIPQVRILGMAPEKASVLLFIIENAHPHDVGTVLDREGIAIRAGHHCAQPVMQRFGVPATARASFGLYNTPDEVDALVEAVHRVIEVFN